MKYEWNIDGPYNSRWPWMEFEIDDEELEDMTDDEIEDYVYSLAVEEMQNHVYVLVRQKENNK